MVSSSIRLTAWLQNSKKRAERSSERLTYEQSHAIISAWVICIIVCPAGSLIINVITPLPTKPSATKMPENWSWRTRQLPTCRCVSDVAALDAKYTKELADAKAGNDARDDAAAVVVGCTSKHRQYAWSTGRLRRDTQASPRLAYRWTGLFHLRERLITIKQLEGTQKYINEHADRAAPRFGISNSCNYQSTHTRFQRV